MPTQATVYIRRILEEALHESAAAIVLAHNHPSGCPEPSAGDDETAQNLLRACKLLYHVWHTRADQRRGNAASDCMPLL